MVRNSFELAVIAQQWANKAKESIAMILEDFMIKNHISFQTLCKIMPIDEDILEDIMSGKSDMITMNELSAIIIALDNLLLFFVSIVSILFGSSFLNISINCSFVFSSSFFCSSGSFSIGGKSSE